MSYRRRYCSEGIHRGYRKNSVEEVPGTRHTYLVFFGLVEITRARFHLIEKCACGGKTRKENSTFSKTVKRVLLPGFEERRNAEREKLGR